MSTLKVDTILKRTGTGTITVGQSGDTISIPSGATLNSAGTNTLTGINSTPSFFAWRNSNQSISDNTWTKIECGSELYDSDSAYDNSTNYRFTPQTAGKYFFFAGINSFGGVGTVQYSQSAFYKNGSSHIQFSYWDFDNNYIYGAQLNGGAVIDMNGSSDYVELYNRTNLSSGTPSIQGNSGKPTFFGAYKITGA